MDTNILLLTGIITFLEEKLIQNERHETHGRIYSHIKTCVQGVFKVRLCYLRLSEPVTMPVVVVDVAVVVVVDVVVVVEPVFIVGMTAADSFSFSFSLSALSSDQYLSTHTCIVSIFAIPWSTRH